MKLNLGNLPDKGEGTMKEREGEGERLCIWFEVFLIFIKK
jgi:hypothetical protein